jgi:hypothetical protein
MSEEIREFVAGEKITVTTTLGHEASGMDHTEGRSLLGNGYRLDLVGMPGVIVLRREDGTEVSSSAYGMQLVRLSSRQRRKTSARISWSKGFCECKVGADREERSSVTSGRTIPSGRW